MNQALSAVVGILLCLQPCLASSVKSDEEVILFPTSAHLEQNNWVVPIHGWIFEPEQDSLWRDTLINSISDALGETVQDSPLLQARLRWFLVDNERSKSLHVRIDEQIYSLQSSKANGHFTETVILNMLFLQTI